MSDLKKESLVYVDVNDDLQSVLAVFFNHSISHAPVMLEKKLIGMISKTDVTQYLYRYLQDFSEKPFSEIIKDIRAKELMVQPLVEASVEDSESVILEKLVASQVSSVVLKDKDKVVGIATEKDLIQYFAKQKNEEGSSAEAFGHSLVQWLDEHGIFQVSRFLSDMGI